MHLTNNLLVCLKSFVCAEIFLHPFHFKKKQICLYFYDFSAKFAMYFIRHLKHVYIYFFCLEGNLSDVIFQCKSFDGQVPARFYNRSNR